MTLKIALPERLEKIRRYLFSRQRHYQLTFTQPSGVFVLRDLAQFCRAHNTTYHQDAAVAQRLDGRREVWLRIQHHLKLTDEKIWQLYTGIYPPIPSPSLPGGQSFNAQTE